MSSSGGPDGRGTDRAADRGNELGSYTYAPTIAADGVTVTASALDNYTSHHPSAYSVNYGDVHYVIHFQEMGAFVQDQIKLSTRLSITPGIRYDWANVFAQNLGKYQRMKAWVAAATGPSSSAKLWFSRIQDRRVR